MSVKHTITPCLWFSDDAEQAAGFYVTVFPDSKITAVSRYTGEGSEIHGMKPGTVLTVAFEINGQPFTALNGGPLFKFSEAISFQVFCDTQDEIDYYWEKLSEYGEPGQCGWLKDRFGISWQVVPAILPSLITDPLKAEKVTAAFMQMTKFEIQKLIEASQ